MKIKGIKEQLIEMGFKTGDRINVKGCKDNPYVLNLKSGTITNKDGVMYSLIRFEMFEFERVVLTKEELIEELKKRSKKFENGGLNYRIVYDFDLQKVTWSLNCYCLDFTTPYFTEGEAKKICDELNADREKIKILFDLEE